MRRFKPGENCGVATCSLRVETEVREEQITEAAARIVDVMMGNDHSWRARIHHSDFLESADWLMALTYARAALGVRVHP
jgi:hypothetical protein